MKCPYCQSNNVTAGQCIYSTKYMTVCNDCGRTFVYDVCDGSTSFYNANEESIYSELRVKKYEHSNTQYEKCSDEDLYNMAQGYEGGCNGFDKDLGKALEVYTVLKTRGSKLAKIKVEGICSQVSVLKEVINTNVKEIHQRDEALANARENNSDSSKDILDVTELRYIYDCVLAIFDKVSGKISLDTKNPNIENLRELAESTLHINYENIKNGIKNLQECAECDDFTIAFYGETNAGKSTIIETLRILLNESTKKQQREDFQSICECRNEDELKILCDGAIIGDGSPDFTQKRVDYHFNSHGKDFVVIDVPGIEGNEDDVRSSIHEAVTKAHAVFYVTCNANAPQTGDGIDGVLQKIKKDLGDQTEVWTIYNKKIQSPETLGKELIDEDENDSLREMDRVLEEELGKIHYRGHISLSALPAFLSKAEFLLPGSSMEKRRRRFSDKFNGKDLLMVTGFSNFIELLNNDVVYDVKNKIEESNLNKIIERVHAVLKDFQQLLGEFKTQEKNIFDKSSELKKKIDSKNRIVIQEIKHYDERKVLEVEDLIRQNIYEQIDKGAKDKNLGTLLAGLSVCYIQMFMKDLQVFCKNQKDVFCDFVRKIYQEHQGNVYDMMEFMDCNIRHFDGGRFVVNDYAISVENRIGWSDAASSGLSIAMDVGAFFMNPGGWLSKIAGVSLYTDFKHITTIFKFFSVDKVAQKQAVEKKLTEYMEHVRTEICEFEKIIQMKMNNVVNEVKVEINSSTEGIKKIECELESANEEFVEIEQKLRRRLNHV